MYGVFLYIRNASTRPTSVIEINFVLFARIVCKCLNV